jgi:glycosyltransferase involved in cell wall biosynthesis
MNISATIITFNEEVHLAQCLESMRGIADELIVVDSGSLDRTRQIAESHGAGFRSLLTNYSTKRTLPGPGGSRMDLEC